MSDQSSVGATRIGDYELIGELGRGGMGVVYRALQLSLNREVALKILIGGEFTSPLTLARFRQEALTAAELNHPSIVRILEVGEHDGSPFYTMDLVEGRGLDEMCDTRPLPWQDAARYVRAIAEAVHYAHDRGVLHRDLKPQNVLVDPFDMPRILDFGLARRLDDPDRLTISGTLVGTPSYMPPELALGQHARTGRHSDVYGLGAILYEILTIRPPIVEGSIPKTLESVVKTEPIAPRKLNPDIPRDLETVCLKCLEKEPERRYPTARDLAEDLDRVLRGEPIRAKPISRVEYGWRWCMRNRAVAALSATTLLLLFASSIVSTTAWVRTRFAFRSEAHQRRIADRERGRARAEERRASDLLARLDMKEAARSAAEGYPEAALAHLARSLRVDPGNRAAAAMAISLLSRIGWARLHVPPLPHDTEVLQAGFGPGARLALTLEERGVARVWDCDAGRQLLATPAGETVRHAALDHSGQALAFATGGGVVQVWKIDGGKPASPRMEHGEDVQFLDFSPDDRRLATLSTVGTLRVWEIATGSPAGNRKIIAGQKPIPERFAWVVDRDIRRVRFSPDGRTLLTASGTQAQVWDAGTLQPVTAPLRHESNIQEARFNGSGSRFVTACLNVGRESYAQIWETATGKPVGPRLPHRFGASHAIFSADDTHLATSSVLGAARVWDAIDGTPVTPWIQGFDPGSAISDDGEVLLYLPRMGTAAALDIDLNREIVRLSSHRNSITSIDFAQGRKLAITGSHDHTARIWEMHSTRTHPLLLPHGAPVISLSFAADGASVLSVTRTGIARLWDLASAKEPLSTERLLPSRVICAAPPPRGEGFAALLEDGRIFLVRGGAAHQIGAPPAGKAPEQQNARILFDPAGERLAAVVGRHCTVLSCASGKGAAPIRLDHGEPILRCSFNGDGSRLLTVGPGGVALWESASGRRLADRPALAGEPADGGFPPSVLSLLRMESRRSGAGTIWDLAGNRAVGEPVVVGKFFRSEVPSTDGRRILTCARGSARVWELATGRPVTEELAHDHLVETGAFSPADPFVATATADGVVRLWDTNTSLLIAEPIRHQGAVTRVEFSPDGSLLASASEDGLVRVAEVIAPRGDAPAWLPPLAEGIGGVRLGDAGIPEPTSDQFAMQEDARRLLRAAPGDDPLTSFGRWFFDTSPERAVTPAARIDRATFVRLCLTSDSLDALQEAREVDPENAEVNRRLADWRPWMGKARSLMQARRFEEGLPYLNRASQLAPANPEMQEAQRRLMEIFSQLGGEPVDPTMLPFAGLPGVEGGGRRPKALLRRRFPIGGFAPGTVQDPRVPKAPGAPTPRGGANRQ